jgi:hypothetical protein
MLASRNSLSLILACIAPGVASGAAGCGTEVQAQATPPVAPPPFVPPPLKPDAFCGCVIDAQDKRPLAGALVSAVSQDQGAAFSPPPPAVTDANGFYCTPSLPPGKYALECTRSGYEASVFLPRPLTAEGARQNFELLPSGLTREELSGVASARF